MTPPEHPTPTRKPPRTGHQGDTMTGMTQTARYVPLAIAAVLLLAGCAGTTDLTACKDAMRAQLKAGADTGRPAQCKGVADADVERMGKELIAEAITGTTVSDSPAAELPTAEETTTTTEEEAIARHKLGETAELSAADGSFAAAITVNSVTSRKKTNSQFGEKPSHGRYVEITVTAVGKSGSFSINPYDFYLLDPDGTRYQYGEGNGFTEEVPNPINAADLKPGEKLKGRLLFDASPKAAVIGYSPSFSGETVAIWSLS
jgi:Domain of unknown function (DUF4352)